MKLNRTRVFFTGAFFCVLSYIVHPKGPLDVTDLLCLISLIFMCIGYCIVPTDK
jgi:hypothetical protein